MRSPKAGSRRQSSPSKDRRKVLPRELNVGEAKALFSQLVDEAARGGRFVIAKAGKPMVKVIALAAPEPAHAKRLGFLKSEFEVPDDFDTMGAARIATLFGDAT